MPVLAIGGAASYGEHVGDAMKLVADDVQSVVIPGAGHWVAEEAPEEMLAALTPFLAPYRDGPTARVTRAPRERRGRSLDDLLERLHMPSLDGATGWLNSEPLGPAELRGHVVLVELLDADLHQLAAPGAVRPRVVAGLPQTTGWS